MPVLTERKVWRHVPKPRTTLRANELTAEEQRNVMAALNVLYVRFGTWRDVAHAMGIGKGVIARIRAGEQKPSAGIAVLAAKLGGVPVEDVLTGAFGEPGKCPMCGH